MLLLNTIFKNSEVLILLQNVYGTPKEKVITTSLKHLIMFIYNIYVTHIHVRVYLLINLFTFTESLSFSGNRLGPIVYQLLRYIFS